MAALVPLASLPVGTSFTTDFGRSGTLVYINECRARVRLRGTGAPRQFETRDGESVTITATSRLVDWAPSTEVYPTADVATDVEPTAEEDTMQTATATKNETPETPRAAKAAKSTKPATVKTAKTKATTSPAAAPAPTKEKQIKTTTANTKLAAAKEKARAAKAAKAEKSTRKASAPKSAKPERDAGPIKIIDGVRVHATEICKTKDCKSHRRPDGTKAGKLGICLGCYRARRRAQ